jgi:hypothetical protein
MVIGWTSESVASGVPQLAMFRAHDRGLSVQRAWTRMLAGGAKQQQRHECQEGPGRNVSNTYRSCFSVDRSAPGPHSRSRVVGFGAERVTRSRRCISGAGLDDTRPCARAGRQGSPPPPAGARSRTLMISVQAEQRTCRLGLNSSPSERLVVNPSRGRRLPVRS